MFTRGVTLLFLPCLVTPLVALYFFAHLPFLLHADCFLPHPIFFSPFFFRLTVWLAGDSMSCLGRLMQLPRSHCSLPATPTEIAGAFLPPVSSHTVEDVQK